MKPNILMIILDACRPDHMSCYGYGRSTTPEVDKVIHDSGILFANAISSSSWTVPSVASLLTGMLPSNHGQLYLGMGLNDGVATLAEVLQGIGYSTICITANDLIADLCGQGFEQFWSYRRLPRPYRVSKRIIASLTGTEDSGANRITDIAIRWIARQSRRGAPFFAYLHYMEGHWKYVAPRSYIKEFWGYPLSIQDILRVSGFWRGMGNRFINENRADKLKCFYDAAITHWDSCVGKLFGFLRRSGLWDNTLLIITSDHGENLGEHGLLGHGWFLYDSLLKVPLIIRYRYLCDDSRRVSAQVQITDIMPTILDILGVRRNESKRSSDEASLLPISQSETAQQERLAFAEVWEPNIRSFEPMEAFYPELYRRGGQYRAFTVRSSQFKFIDVCSQIRELYDLRSDPDERQNVANIEKDQVSYLSNILRTKVWGLMDRDQFDLDESEKAAIEKRLRDLGYL